MYTVHILSCNHLHLLLTSRTMLNASHLITSDFLVACNKPFENLIKERDAIRHTRGTRSAVVINNISVLRKKTQCERSSPQIHTSSSPVVWNPVCYELRPRERPAIGSRTLNTMAIKILWKELRDVQEGVLTIRNIPPRGQLISSFDLDDREKFYRRERKKERKAERPRGRSIFVELSCTTALGMRATPPR